MSRAGDQSGHCCIALVNYSRMLATMNEKARENMSLPSATGGWRRRWWWRSRSSGQTMSFSPSSFPICLLPFFCSLGSLSLRSCSSSLFLFFLFSFVFYLSLLLILCLCVWFGWVCNLVWGKEIGIPLPKVSLAFRVFTSTSYSLFVLWSLGSLFVYVRLLCFSFCLLVLCVLSLAFIKPENALYSCL